MTSRILPPEEWSRLEGTELGPVWRALDPALVRVIVIEDDQSAIVGCWSLMPFIHAEGLWIAPEHRGKGAVLRALWMALRASADELGLQSVVTSANSDAVTDILVSRGAKPMPASYVLNMDPKPNAGDRHRGEQFHAQLFALLPESAQHPDDANHDAAVGRALRIGLDEGDPVKAERQYNVWALAHGYAPVQFIGAQVNALRLDIVEAIIDVQLDGSVALVQSRLEAPCRP